MAGRAMNRGIELDAAAICGSGMQFEAALPRMKTAAAAQRRLPLLLDIPNERLSCCYARRARVEDL
jgi:hypothetical protein